MNFRRMGLETVQQFISDEDHDCFGKFSNSFASNGSPIILPNLGSVVSKTTSFVLKMMFSSYMALASVRESVRTRDVGWSFRHSSRITHLLDCVFTLEHFICT